MSGRRLVFVYFSGVGGDTSLHRAKPDRFAARCGVELEQPYTGWFPGDLVLELVEAGDRVCRRQGCFHPRALERLRRGELGHESKEVGES